MCPSAALEYNLPDEYDLLADGRVRQTPHFMLAPSLACRAWGGIKPRVTSMLPHANASAFL